MIKELNLLGYLPQFMQEYREIQECILVEEPVLNQANLEINSMLQNQFILSTNLSGIAIFENMLGILPSSSDSLQARQLRVLMQWNDVPPYTLKYLIATLDNLYGAENYELITNFNEYQFGVKFIQNLPESLLYLNEFVNRIKPANLIFDITAKSQHSSENFAGVFVGGKYIKSLLWIDDFTNQTDVLSTNYIGGRHVKSKIIID